ncbi:hypothetical protein ASD88_17885 [Pelomonas sp. Root662]|nr:hypothetical protein [Pelomonas sp. Root405]KQW44649.1 hypothetical protein ASC81_13725 [Pelomonas sp. Root405]KRA70008.1 hypothetical protein ASD88_17885 [Pelomonas sp. Root662]
MTTKSHDKEASFDDALREQLQAGGEPDDAGFSLRVMAALPVYGVTPRQRRWARWVRRAQWAAISFAACGAAALIGVGHEPPDAPRALAAAALVGLLIFWSLPTRWSRG